MSRGIRLSDLPPSAQKKLAEQGQLPGFDVAAAERSRAQSKRARSGHGFEAELKAVHEIYKLQRRAKVRRVDPPTVHNGEYLQYRKGGASVDFEGTIAGGTHVLFDAKVCEDATYTHDPERMHQLDFLLEHEPLEARAFLLVCCRTLGVAYLIEGREHLERLRRGEGLLLRELIPGKGRAMAGHPERFRHHFPLVRRSRELLTSQSDPTWDWLTTLLAHTPNRED